MTAERRRSPRSIIDGEVRVVTGGSSYLARLKTLSRLGALLELGETLSVGTPLSVLIDLPGSESRLELRGQVLRAEPSEGAVSVAVMFAPLAPFALAQIDSLLASTEA